MSTDFLNSDGTPNLPELIAAKKRCAPAIPGGLEWIDDVAMCRWAGQSGDGRKHDAVGDPNGAARPWDGASDCRPMVVDDAVNDLVSMLSSGFWRSMAQRGGGLTEGSAYAVTLAEHLIFTQMLNELVDEVELSAQYTCRYGWCLLAPRWVDEVGLRRQQITIEEIVALAQQAPPDAPVSRLPAQITDPEQEAAAVEFVTSFYDAYVQAQLPERVRDRVPKTSKTMARKIVVDLRTTGKAEAPMPYLCRSEPEISALKPWEDVFVPPEMSASKMETVFHVEYLSEADLRGRIITEGYKEAWVDAACKFKGQIATSNLPVGVSGQALTNLRSGPTGAMATGLDSSKYGLITIVHAIYRATADDNVPGVYSTTFHECVSQDAAGNDLYASHELVQSQEGALPYVDSRFEAWARPLSTSRGVPEMTFTDQNLIKGLNDQMIDRASITTVPPVNVYTSPTGAKYQFSPGAQNYVSQAREPKFMEMPSGQGTVDNLQAEERVARRVDNRFGLPDSDTPPSRQQSKQERLVRRFLLAWGRAVQYAIALYQENGDDAQFAEITGAPAGWLDGHRNTKGALSVGLSFDVRELDSELFLKQIEAVNQVVLPQDVLGTVNRGAWTRTMMRGINPAWAREVVMPQSDASQALLDKANLEVLKMFAGNQPNYVDQKDPTAGGLLQYTKQIVTQNPNYLRAMSDEALMVLAGPQTGQLAQMIGQRQPDPRFSGLLIKWLQNLQFVGVTQPANKQIGRIGVDPEAGGGVGGQVGG